MGRKWSVYGPSKHGRKWRIRIRSPQGDLECLAFATKDEALEAKEAALREIDGEDAQERAADHFARGEAALLEAELTGQGRRTVSDALAAYEVERREMGRVKEVTIVTERHRLNALLGPIGSRAVVAVGERLASARYQERAREADSAATHRGQLAAARQFWKWLVKKRWAQVNPWMNVEPIGQVARGKEQLRSMELERLRDQLLEVARAPGDWNSPRSRRLGALAVLVALYEGLRTSEVVGLEKRDLGRRKLTYRKAKRRKGQIVLATVKVPAELDGLLHERAATLPSLDSRLFPREAPWVRRRTQAFCESAGVTVVCAQGLRGSHASTAVEAGATADDVARQLGHNHTAVTERHYIREDVACDASAERVAAELALEADSSSGGTGDILVIAREIARLQLRLERAIQRQEAGQEMAENLDQNPDRKSPG